MFISKEELEIKTIESAETIPSKWYTSPDSYHFDNEKVFQKTWQYVAPLSQLETEKAIFTTIADNNIVIVKENEAIKAFHNVCRHRAGALGIKNKNTFQCKYHGWTYNFNGELKGTPEFDGAKEFEKKDFCLFPVKVAVFENMLFASLDENIAPIETFFEGIIERIKPIDLNKKQFYCRISYEINCNWKVYVDNYLEGYHLPHVHPELNNMLDYQDYDTELYDNYSLQYSPVKESKENIYSSGAGEAFYYFVLPNFMLNILPNRLQVNSVVPISYNKTKVIFDYYYDDLSDANLDFIKNDLEYSDLIQKQDIEVCETVQSNLNSKVYSKGRFSVKRETGVHHFQSILKKFYAK